MKKIKYEDVSSIAAAIIGAMILFGMWKFLV